MMEATFSNLKVHTLVHYTSLQTSWWSFTLINTMGVHLLTSQEVPQPSQGDRSSDQIRDNHRECNHREAHDIDKGKRDEDSLSSETLVGIVPVY